MITLTLPPPIFKTTSGKDLRQIGKIEPVSTLPINPQLSPLSPLSYRFSMTMFTQEVGNHSAIVGDCHRLSKDSVSTRLYMERFVGNDQSGLIESIFGFEHHII